MLEGAGPIDPDVSHTLRQAVRFLEFRQVPDSYGVEDHDVGVVPGTEEATVAEAEAGRHRRAHLADGVLQRDHPLIADVPSEDARVAAVSTRMGRSQLGGPGRVEAAGVGPDRDPRLAQLLDHVL